MIPCVCGCPAEHSAHCVHGCVLPELDDGTPTRTGSIHPNPGADPYAGIYGGRYTA